MEREVKKYTNCKNYCVKFLFLVSYIFVGTPEMTTNENFHVFWRQTGRSEVRADSDEGFRRLTSCVTGPRLQ